MKVYLVMEMTDDEYFYRDVVYVAATYDKAVEWVEQRGGFHDVICWDDNARPYWSIDEWVIDK